MKKCPSCDEKIDDDAETCSHCGKKCSDAPVEKAPVKEEPSEIFDAVESGDIEKVKELLKSGVPVNIKGNNQWTSLHMAAQENQTEIAEFLISQGADLNARTDENWTALHLAAQEGDIEMSELLLNYGAELNLQNDDGQMPLDIVLEYSNKYNELVSFLTHYGEEEEKDEEGNEEEKEKEES